MSILFPSAVPQSANLRLNLGCGYRPMEGYVNVDLYGRPDLVLDLETFPWPWSDNTVAEVQLIQVLEHLGRDPKVYLNIWQELYRICKPRAKLIIEVPHHRHDNFYDDPTHVRAVTPLGVRMFSQRLNREWNQRGYACSSLGLNLGVNFELRDISYQPSSVWFQRYPEPEVNWQLLLRESQVYNNLIQSLRMVVEVIKFP
jgi:hypothetical protein